VLRRLLIAGLLAAAAAVPPAGAQRQLLPGLTYDRQIQFTTHGPVVLNVLVGPRPGGLWSLQPVLSNDGIVGTEPLTGLESRLAAGATVAGVNGDLFNAQTGSPTGMLMRGGALEHPPVRTRSSLGIDSAGNLLVARVQLLATWQGSGQRRAITQLNDAPQPNGVALFTPAWGGPTPTVPGSSVAVVLSSFTKLAQNQAAVGAVSQVVQDVPVGLPPGGAVIVARGTAALKLAQEAPAGQTIVVRPTLKPDWNGVVGAIGGGPVVVRNGRAVFRANELFTTEQLLSRAPRAAVGQLGDGRIVLVAVDGGQPGYSTGMTNFELGQALVRLGAVTGMALGPGAPVAMAFDGQLLSRPSAGAEQPISDALLFEYAGVYAAAPSDPAISPNGDAVADKEELSYKLVRTSTVSVSLVGPDGAQRFSFAGPQQPGTYPFEFTGLKSDGTPDVEGAYRFVVNATDDLGRASAVEQDFSLNLTLGAPRALGTPLTVPRTGPRAVVAFTLVHPASVTLRIETQAGVVVRTIATNQQAAPGELDVAWDGLTDAGTAVYSGRYVARAIATNELGTVDLTQAFDVQRVANPR